MSQTPELELSAFELRSDHADDFAGGSVNIGNGETLNLAEALEAGTETFKVDGVGVEVDSPEGEIVVRAGTAAEDALRGHPAFKSTKAPDVDVPNPELELFTSESAARKAQEAGLSASQIEGTGADGKVKVEDVEKAIADRDTSDESNATEGEAS